MLQLYLKRRERKDFSPCFIFLSYLNVGSGWAWLYFWGEGGGLGNRGFPGKCTKMVIFPREMPVNGGLFSQKVTNLYIV